MVSARVFEKRVKDTVEEYNLISQKDRVIVAVSGGKDSTTALYLLKKLGFKVEALIIDLLIGDYSKRNLDNVTEFCRQHKVKLHVVNMRKEFGSSICHIRSCIQSKTNMSNCLICGVIKRWILNQKARELGATRIATGHNLDDEIETVMMNMFNGNPGLSANLSPITGSVRDAKFVPRVKPLYFCTNEEIREYSKAKKFPVLYAACPCATGAFRREVRAFVSGVEKYEPDVKRNIIMKFLDELPAIRASYCAKGSIKHCSVCGEPSRNEVCKRCGLLKILRSQ